jgi:hypothetical protein
MHGGSQGEFDGEPPTIQIVVPIEDSVISTRVPFHAEASDESNIASFTFAGDPLPSFLSSIETTITGHTAVLEAFLELNQLVDGPVVIVVEAVDTHGNKATAERSLVVNKSSPVLEWLEPTGPTVSGDVLIRARAEDPNGIIDMKLSGPALHDLVFDSATQVVSAVWNTKSAPVDGQHVVEAHATDTFNNTSTISRVLSTDNYNPGLATGRVYLDTPVYDVRVQILPVTDGVRGDPFETVYIADGPFELELPDTYMGILLLRAFGASAHYTDAATGVDVQFEAETELLSLFHYAPSSDAAGVLLDQMSVHAATTLAAYLAEALVNGGASFDTAIEQAHVLIGRHLERTIRPDGIAIRQTPVADWLATPSTAEDQRLLGLFHVGLSRWGAEACLQHGLKSHCRPTVRLLGFLAQDIADTCFDGLGVNDLPVWVISPQHLALTPDTLRVHHASATSRWLENVPLPGGITNETGISSAQYAVPGGFFDALSLNQGDLFCGAAGTPYDREPPAAKAHLVNGSGQTVDTDAPITGSVVLVVSATDTTGFAADPVILTPEGSFGPNQLENPGPTDPTLLARYPFDTTTLADGPQTITISVVDVLGRASFPIELDIIVDNTPPTLHVDIPTIVDDPVGVSIFWELDDVVGMYQTLAFDIDGGSWFTINTPAATGHVYRSLSVCDRQFTWRAVLTDGVGHQTSVAGTFDCDNRPPLVQLLPSQYVPEDDMEVTFGPNSFQLIDGSATPIDISGGALSLVKYRNRYYGGAPNMPRLHFSANDTGTVSTPTDRLIVEYKYLFSPGGNGKWQELRNWTALERDVDRYTVELSPENLATAILTTLPEDLHRVVFRAVDEVGHEVLLDYDFHLEILPIPLVFSACRVSSELQQANLRQQTMAGFFDANRRPLLRATLSWPVGNATAYPWPSVQASVSDATATTTLTDVGDPASYDLDEEWVKRVHESATWCTVAPEPGTWFGACRYLDTGVCLMWENAYLETCDTLRNEPMPDSIAAHHTVLLDVRDGSSSAWNGSAFAVAPNVLYDVWVDAETMEVYWLDEVIPWEVRGAKTSFVRYTFARTIQSTTGHPCSETYCHYWDWNRENRADINAVRVDMALPVVSATDPAYPGLGRVNPVVTPDDSTCGGGFSYIIESISETVVPF